MFKLVTLFVVAVSRACTNLAVDMESHVDGARGAAARRRQRRLRAQWQHEKQSVAMALTEALHHSSGPTTMKVVERREGPEGEVRETHDGLRAQERPLPGTRPAPLFVGAEPQDRLEAAARVSAGVPSVAPPALAAPAAEGVGRENAGGGGGTEEVEGGGGGEGGAEGEVGGKDAGHQPSRPRRYRHAC